MTPPERLTDRVHVEMHLGALTLGGLANTFSQVRAAAIAANAPEDAHVRFESGTTTVGEPATNVVIWWPLDRSEP